MLPEEEFLQKINSWYYVTSIFLALASNLILFYYMKTTKSAMLKNMQYYFIFTSVLEIIVSISTFLGQCRPVANIHTLAVFCYGPCKYVGQTGCHLTFAVVQCSVVTASLSLVLSFYYRYRIIVSNGESHIKNFVVFSIFPISMLAFQLLTDADIEKVELETRAMHEDYDFVKSSLIGFSDIESIGSIVAQLMISFGVILSPCVAFYYKRKINKILSSNMNPSAQVTSSKQLVNGLLIQTLIPFLVYIPPYSYFLYSNLTGTSNIYLEYLLNIFGSIPAFLNPIFTLIFVTPYRKSISADFSRFFSTKRF